MFALYIGGMGAKGKNFYNDLACQYGYEEEAEEIQDLYLDGKKDEAAAPSRRAARGVRPGRSGVLRQGADRGLQRAGVTHLNVVPATEDPAATIAQLKEWIS